MASFRWHKKNGLPRSTSYPGGIDQRVKVEPVRYSRDNDLSFVLTGERRNPRNATLQFTNGNLGTDAGNPGPNPLSVPVSVNPFGVKILAPNDFKVHMSMNPLTARFSGNFRHPDTGEKIQFSGAMRSADGIVLGEGRGNFLSRGAGPRDPNSAMSGSVRLTLD